MSNNPNQRHSKRHALPYRQTWDEQIESSFPFESGEYRNDNHSINPYQHQNWSFNNDHEVQRNAVDEERMWSSQPNLSPLLSLPYNYDIFEPIPMTTPSLKIKENPSNEEKPEDYRTISNFLSYDLSRENNREKKTDKIAFQPPKSRKKRPKGMPKRPLSAYNLFFQSERVKIINGNRDSSNAENSEADHAHENDTETKQQGKHQEGKRSGKSRKPPHGKISFERLGRLIGARWKEIPEEEKKEYQERAEEESNRYANEMEEYHQKTNKNIKKQKLFSFSKGKDKDSDKEDRTKVTTTSEPQRTASKDDDATNSKPKLNAFANMSWSTVPSPKWNKPLSVTVNDAEGVPREYYLTYAAVRMTKKEAMEYISNLSQARNFVDQG